MSSSIRQAKAAPPIFAPLDDLRAAGIVTRLFQGCAFAVDPRDRRGYLFQLQAVKTGPGDVQDLRVHRFRYHSDGTPAPLEYVDTMTILRGGHVQQGHVRISENGIPYLWLGLEEYDQANVQHGAATYRVRYTPTSGQMAAGTRQSSNVQRVYTGDGTAVPVGCPDWTIVLRRPGRDADTYEWHRERYLLSDKCQRDAKNGDRPNPWHSVTVAKEQPDDDYQSSTAQGKYDDRHRRAYRTHGADVVLVTNSDTPGQPLDLTDRARAALGGAGVNVEPEGLCTIGGLLHVAVQTGSVARRRIAYFPLSW